MAGLGSSLAIFLLLVALGVEGNARDALLIFVQFLALFIAGFVAGRFGERQPSLDGGFAGLLTFFVAVALSVAGGSSLGVVPMVLLGVVAAVLGSAGGVLAESMRRR